MSAVGNLVANNSVQSKKDSIADDSDTHYLESTEHDGMAVNLNISQGTQEETAIRHAISSYPSLPRLKSLVQLKVETDKYDKRVVNLSIAHTEEETAIIMKSLNPWYLLLLLCPI